MSLNKIQDSDLVGKGVLGQEDTPGLSIEDMQLSVEGIPREVIIPKFNALIDALSSATDGDSGADNIKATAITSVNGTTVQSILEGLKAYADSLALSSGVVTSVFGRAGAVLPQAGDYTLTQVGGSRANILDNWYNIFPVNQRTLSSYTGNQYNRDRWRNNSSGIITTLESNGVKITLPGSTSYMWGDYQIIPNGAQYIGQTLTLSALIPDVQGSKASLIISCRNSSDSEIGAVTTPITSAGLVSVEYTAVPEGTVYIRTGVYIGANSVANDYVIVHPYKLEQGKGQTLAYWDGTKYVLIDPPPNPQQELDKCMQYAYADSGATSTYRSVASTANNIDFVINTPVPLRDSDKVGFAPSIVFSDFAYRIYPYNNTGAAISEGFTFSVLSGYYSPNQVAIRAAKTAHGMGGDCVLQFLSPSTHPFMLSREL